MSDPPRVKAAIESALKHINEKKRSSNDHLKYEELRGLAVSAYQELRRSNPEASLVDGVLAVLKTSRPDLFKEESKPVSQPKPEPESKVESLTDDDELLRRFHRMKSMSDLEQQFQKGNPYKTVSDSVWKSSLDDKYKKLKAELDELGGRLTKKELDYVYTIPDAVMKVNKLKVRGLGKNCSKCGLPKQK